MRKHLQLLAWTLVPAAYIIAYFGTVRVQSVVEDREHNRSEAGPGYGVLRSELFIPIHFVDRSLLRPKMWSYPGTMEDYERHMGVRP